jgi:hypothetical protein
VEIAALSRPFPGESQNGDGYLIAGLDDEADSRPAVITSLGSKYPESLAQTLDASGWGRILIAVIDGVGHGAEAAVVTKKLIDCLQGNLDCELSDLVKKCHQSVLHSRGAALGIAVVDKRKSNIEYLGVGNVRAQLGPLDMAKRSIDINGLHLRSTGDEKKVHEFISNNGIVGYNLPSRLASFAHEYLPDNMIVMFTDGIEEKFSIKSVSSFADQHPASLAESVLSEFGKSSDDATIVIAN